MAGIKRKKGFSLVELLTIVAIISIMTTISLVSLMENKKKREVEVEARSVAAAIRQAQNYALTGKGASPTCTSYTFSWTNGGASYSSGGGSCVANTYSLRNGVTFGSNSTNSLAFSVPRAESSGTTKILLGKGTYNFTVCVYQTGRVEENSGNISC